MTKRRLRNDAPKGFNKSLGNSLVKQGKAKRVYIQPNVAQTAAPEKVLDSVTHESNLDEFLNNAELANRDFTAERSNVKIISTAENTIVNPDDLVHQSFEELRKKYGELLKIPRRPLKGTYKTANELHALEEQSFLDWKRNVSLMQESHGVVMTPFERNLELWRQLWRVIERSDVIVQIVDARNPLLFHSADLDAYVKEVDPAKGNVVLVNKSDLLSPEHIEHWREHFRREKIPAVFWSAKSNIVDPTLETVKEEEAATTSSTDTDDDEAPSSPDVKELTNAVDRTDLDAKPAVPEITVPKVDDIPFIHTTDELIAFFKAEAFKCNPGAEKIVVGMVGYPNVGKSSTINCIFGKKKTSVSATPGKTKHFQTLIIDNELTLCDCPGLVMPSFGFSASEMILNCILPVDKMRDFFSPVQVLSNRVPRRYLEALYSILLPKPTDNEDPQRPPTAHELLTTIAFMKGFMSSSGIPDCSRAARIVLKDVVNGKLRWIAAPPGVDQAKFDEITFSTLPEKKQVEKSQNIVLEQLEKRNLLLCEGSSGRKVDSTFFGGSDGVGHVVGVRGRGPTVDESGRIRLKKGKKEKLRRVYKHLDA